LGVSSLRVLPAVSRITNSITLLRLYKYSIDIIYSKLKNKKKIRVNHYINYKFEELNLTNVNFQRENNKLILKDVNLNFFKNDWVGIKGLSGSGKTTLIDLICGLLKPNKGKIILNKKINLTKIKGTIPIKIGYVPQDIFLLNDSLQANIAFGLPINEKDQNKIINVMKLCKLEKFIKNKKSIAKININEDSNNLSGGEKQRIAIARAIYPDPELLIFDEFTSSLDDKTERDILKNLKKILKNKTAIFISHKKRSLANCKKIYTFKNKTLI